METPIKTITYMGRKIEIFEHESKGFPNPMNENVWYSAKLNGRTIAGDEDVISTIAAAQDEVDSRVFGYPNG